MQKTKSRPIGLFVIEEQEIYINLYKLILAANAELKVLGVSTDPGKKLEREIARYSPDVLLLSAKHLEAGMVKELEQARKNYPKMGIVILIIYYCQSDIELIRKLAASGSGGMAFFLKPSLDSTEQLYNIITATSQGQVILDPKLSSLLIMGKPEYPVLKQLTSREMEILGLLAKGFSNVSIARSLFIDLKTVEHHINNMYSKLRTGTDFEQKHPRVNAARLYLEAVGELSSTLTSGNVPERVGLS